MTGQPRNDGSRVRGGPLGVRRFGFGGANAHVVIEQGPGSWVRRLCGPAPVVTSFWWGRPRNHPTGWRFLGCPRWLTWMEDCPGAEVGVWPYRPTRLKSITTSTRHGHSPTVVRACEPRAGGWGRAGRLAGPRGKPPVGVVGPHEGSLPGRDGCFVVLLSPGGPLQWGGHGPAVCCGLMNRRFARGGWPRVEPVFVRQAGFSRCSRFFGRRGPVSGDRPHPPLLRRHAAGV